VSRERTAKQREGNEIEFSRIVAFSDGVFSIAITLLVLNLGIAKDLASGEVAEALWGQRENLLAYALSFAVIGRYWLVHHRFFSDVTAFDGKLIRSTSSTSAGSSSSPSPARSSASTAARPRRSSSTPPTSRVSS